MRSRLRNFMLWTERQYSLLPPIRLPFFHPAELTKFSWARRISSCDEVPEAYQSTLAPLLAGGRTFPYMLLTPTFEHFMHRTTEKLLCDFKDEITILERTGPGIELHHFPLADISYVEVRSMLLDFQFRISGRGKTGSPSMISLKCNSVCDQYFTPILNRIRLRAAAAPGPLLNSELENFNFLAPVNYKFLSFARRSLLGGERVFQVIYQPEIRAGMLAILGKSFKKTISPAHLLILTDRECILIRDDETWDDEDKHGGIWDYIPLDKITCLSWSEQTNGLLRLSIELPAGERFALQYQPAARQDLEELAVSFSAGEFL